MIKRILFFAIVLSLVAGCDTMGRKEGLGTVVGATAGGILGHQVGRGSGKTAATVAGIFLGGMLGRNIGASLDQYDKELLSKATYNALESQRIGEASEWRNPDTGHRGTVVPTKTYQSATGRYCREFQQTVTIGNEAKEAYGTACRQPDGSWKIISG